MKGLLALLTMLVGLGIAARAEAAATGTVTTSVRFHQANGGYCSPQLGQDCNGAATPRCRSTPCRWSITRGCT